MARIAFASALGLTALVFLGFLVFAASVTRRKPPLRDKADAIVALTGGTLRIRHAANLLKRNHANRLLISGVHARTTRRDLRALTGLSKQMFDCCVDIGREAQNTRGNADETRAWLNQHGFKSLIVVTASYHVPRSMVELNRTMPHIQFYPAPVVPKAMRGGFWWMDPVQIRLIGHEYLKYLPSLALALPGIIYARTTAPDTAPPDSKRPQAPTRPPGRSLSLSSGQM